MHASDSFLLMGQSNMAGRGRIGEVPAITDPAIIRFRDGTWDCAVEPVHNDKPETAGVGLAMSFAASFRADQPESVVGLIPTAVGGTPLSRWQPDGDLYQRALSMYREAQPKAGRLRAVLWHQGENDSQHAETAATYAERFIAMATQLRHDLEAPDLPIIIGELGHFISHRPELFPHFTTVNEQLRAIPEQVPHCRVVSATELTDNGDHLHLDAASLRRLGERYYTAYRDLQA